MKPKVTAAVIFLNSAFVIGKPLNAAGLQPGEAPARELNPATRLQSGRRWESDEQEWAETRPSRQPSISLDDSGQTGGIMNWKRRMSRHLLFALLGGMAATTISIGRFYTPKLFTVLPSRC